MPKFMVQAVQRQGYDGSWRAGRKWPSSAPVEVEVVNQKEDPAASPEKGIQLGTDSWKKIQGDPSLRVLPAGDPLAMARAAEDVPTLKAEIERLATENERLRTENQRLQKGSGEKAADRGGGGRRHEAG